MTPNARAILDALGRSQGIAAMNFDSDGLIPIALEELQIALGYRAGEDCFFLFGLVAPQPELDDGRAWSIFDVNRDLCERGMRLAVDPRSGALVLVVEIHCAGLEFYQFDHTLNDFVRTFAELTATGGLRKTNEEVVATYAPPYEGVIFRA
jgi:hypothetical protein